MASSFQPEHLINPQLFKKTGTLSERIDFAWLAFNDTSSVYSQQHKDAALLFLKKQLKTNSIDELTHKMNIKLNFNQANAFEVIESFKRLNIDLSSQVANYLPVAGPMPKSKYTYDYENLVRLLMSDAPFESKPSETGQLLIFKDYTFNISQILAHAELSHLSFTANDFLQYERYCKNSSQVKPEIIGESGLPEYPTDEYFKHQDKTKLFTELSYAEKLAINLYSTNYYDTINPFMRGNYSFDVKPLSEQRDVIIHAAMLGKALGNHNNSFLENSFRFEGIYDEALLAKRIHISQNGGAEIIKGFISTGKQPAFIFENKVAITYTHLKGKFIAPLSRYPHEREFLIPPTQITYEGHTQTGKTHYFHARPIIDLSLIQQEAQTLANINHIIDSKMHELTANLQSLKLLVLETYPPENYELHHKQLETLTHWEQMQKDLLMQDIEKISKKSILLRLTQINERLSELSDAINRNYLTHLHTEDYKLGFNDQEVDNELSKVVSYDWTHLNQAKKQIDDSMTSIKQNIIAHEAVENLTLLKHDCINYLERINEFKFGDKDKEMLKFVNSQINLIERDGSDIYQISALRVHLKATLNTLQEDKQSIFIRQTIHDLREKKGIRMESKAQRIEEAMGKVPLLERNQIHKAQNNAKAVLQALASHRSTFRNGQVFFKSDGEINEKKAATTFLKFQDKLKMVVMIHLLHLLTILSKRLYY